MAVLYLPWVVVQAGYLGSRANARAATLSLGGVWDVVSRSFGAFFIGTTVEGAAQVVLALCFCGLFVLGWLRTRRTSLAQLLLLSILLPMLGALAFNPLLPHFRERFLLLSSLPFVLFVAEGMQAGAAKLARGAGQPQGGQAEGLPLRSGDGQAGGGRLQDGQPQGLPLQVGIGLLLLASALVAVFVLNQYWFDARFHKGEYDLAIDAIKANEQPGDALLVYSPIQDALYGYYHIDGLAAYSLPGADLAAVSAEHPRAWLLLYGDPAVYDPTHAAETFLSERGFKAFYQSYRDGALARYDFPGGDAVVENRQIGFGAGVLLSGFALPGTVARGQTLPVTLQWQARAPLAENYSVFVHLLGADGKVAAQMDSQPAGGTRPTRSWPVGETVLDRLGVAIPAALPPGRYTVEAGMYLLQSGQRLPVRDAGELRVQDDAVSVGEVDVR